MTVKTALDYETATSHTVTVTATDDAATPESATATVTITVTNVAAGLSGPATANYAEGATGRRAATYTVDDEVTWTVSGDDAAKFSIDGGLLRFKAAPDHEFPGDVGTDNVYDVTVSANDGGTTDAETQAVKVTVTNVNERGTVALTTLPASVGTALTATLTDPDTPTGTTTWKWERSAGRLAWETISGATAASYTATAADVGRLLRATATYADDHGAGQSASAATAGPVLANKLSSLVMTGPDTARVMHPTFDANTLHYAAECATGAWTMTLSAPAAARLSVDGAQRANTNATVSFSGLDRERDIEIVVADSSGASTTYVVHCFDSNFPVLTANTLVTGEDDGELLLLSHNAGRDDANNSLGSVLLLVDRNGVARVRVFAASIHGFVRFFEDGPYAYAYARNPNPSQEWMLLDKDFKVGQGPIKVVPPIAHTDPHDFLLRPNGDYVFMSYNSAQRDFSFLSNDLGIQKVADEDERDGLRPCGADDMGCADWATEQTRDSAIQLRAPTGTTAKFNWNSYGNMAIEDCLTHRFPDDYAHINSFDWNDGDIIASFRGCNKVLRIDPSSGNIEWRIGRSIWSRAEWITKSSGAGPAALDVVGDPEGEFCGQHGATILPNGHLLLYDNGVHCFLNPVTGERFRNDNEFSRAVEYALDLDNDEAVFQRDHSLGGPEDKVGFAAGNVEALDNGDWLITWGRGWQDDDTTPPPPDGVMTQVDPATNTEKFSLNIARASTPTVSEALARVVAVPPVALAATTESLTAQVARSADAHTGTGSSPAVVVAFNQPVADPVAATPTVSVTGATVASVAAHREAGVAANAYAFTLAPTGDAREGA